jgi:hypothetical protein
MRAVAADGEDGVDTQFFRVGEHLPGNIAGVFLAILESGLVLKGIAAVGGTEDGAAAYASEREFTGPLGPDETIEAIGDADDFPMVLENGGLDRGPNDGVEAGRVAAPGADANAANFTRITRLIMDQPVDNVGRHTGMFNLVSRDQRLGRRKHLGYPPSY